MRYYKELDIDFTEIQNAIINEYDAKSMNKFWNNIEQNHMKILEKMFEPLNITPTEYVLINANSKNYVVHTDLSIMPYRINIPILNCEYSSTHFFKVKDPNLIEVKKQELRDRKTNIGKWPGLSDYSVPKMLKEYAGADFLKYNLNEVELVTQVILKKPTILNIREPHAVAVIKKDIPRLSISIEFKENLEPLFEHDSMPQP